MPAKLTPEQRRLRNVSERAWQTRVENMLTATGWLWYHAPDNRPVNGHVQNIRAGFPDLFAVRGPRAIVLELKSETGKTRPDQLRWLAAMTEAGIEAYVFRPSDEASVLELLQPTWKVK